MGAGRDRIAAPRVRQQSGGEMALTVRPVDERPDDYLVLADDTAPRTPISVRFLHGLQILLVVVIAALSLAVFWLIALMFGIF
jgi:xanthine/CO dehydrogenase XdhC/CoxF family maturation factor